MPATVSSAAAGRPVRSSSQCTTTTTATAASPNSRTVSMLTPLILREPGRTPPTAGMRPGRSGCSGQRVVPDQEGTIDLFSPGTRGGPQLANRVVMAPLTRMRSGASGVPGDLVVEHYAQRAGVGLIVTEGTYPRHESQAFVGQPGIVTDEQVAGWRRVADAVHARGGRIVMQVMHGGRVTHPDVNGGRRVEAPSAIAIRGEGHTEHGKQPYPVPHALSPDEAREVLQSFVTASRRAVEEAGLDGVELHGANGYLLHEFLAPSSNQRTDVYGGSPENRARFVAEVVEAVAAAIGAGRVGLRLSPEHGIQDALEPDRDDVLATYGGLLDRLRPLGLAYLSVLHREPD